jgi:hypothetical protein
MKKFIGRAFILFLVFATQMQSLSPVVYAQDASGSAGKNATQSAQTQTTIETPSAGTANNISGSS